MIRCCIASALRTYYCVLLSQTDDVTWAVLPIGFTAFIELFCAQLVACLPVMPVFYQHIRQQVLGSKPTSAPSRCSRSRPISPSAIAQALEQTVLTSPLAGRGKHTADMEEKIAISVKQAERNTAERTWLVIDDTSSSVGSEHVVLERPASALTREEVNDTARYGGGVEAKPRGLRKVDRSARHSL